MAARPFSEFGARHLRAKPPSSPFTSLYSFSLALSVPDVPFHVQGVWSNRSCVVWVAGGVGGLVIVSSLALVESRVSWRTSSSQCFLDSTQ